MDATFKHKNRRFQETCELKVVPCREKRRTIKRVESRDTIVSSVEVLRRKLTFRHLPRNKASPRRCYGQEQHASLTGC
ncbi:hypothetical protein CEXT_672131 [Caerostris extrusa]|uniref:Uncharacterized protein n=1 Tax=Caerostris extrusa TaxID=172846 RepID=A0AAV4RMF3_CAEEX|nr:hypothetical protein CEXT_672131 [Caerostris extrusa]